ncbi:alpha/beta fold hydrolase [Qipengyuania sediminis]|uniref:alpha/beta fold hydrolase n=1 Tax=Qipengyuania sediminis TaxID=1532023 RepID=UPI0010595CBF|nr:alpha/beta fold hydrolase [Qipengyuania sediminis]
MHKLPFTPVVQRLLDDPDDFLDRIRSDAAGFAEEVLEEEGPATPPSGVIPTLGSIAIAVFDTDGVLVHHVIPDWWPGDYPIAELRESLPAPDGGARLQFIRTPQGRYLRAVCVTGREAAGWNLPYATRESVRAHPESHLLLGVDASWPSRALAAATMSFGLNGLQRKAVLAVLQTGNGREAAAALKLSYATVREALSETARLMRAPNLPAVIRRVVETSFGILPSNFDSAAELAGWLPLTMRQCQICELIAEGVSRQATASAMRISPAVVKKELEQIFAVLSVSSAAELARTWVEAKALRQISRSTDTPLGFFDPLVEPTHFLPRADDRQVIAWSDYGPSSGRPVLVVHSNWTCRAVPRPFVLQLQAAGWRPIAIDRPGFGSTHPGTISVMRPFDQAIADTLDVLNRLKIDRIPVVARRGAHFTTALKARLGKRIGPVLMVSPNPPTRDAGRRTGIVGVIKEAFYRSPQLIEFYFRVVTAQLSFERMEKLTRAICAGSPPDEALCDDEQFIRDRFKAIRPFSTGNLKGAIVEETIISRNLASFEPMPCEDCMIVQGHHDNHYAYDEVIEFWSAIWPRATLIGVEDAGQFMTSSHPQLLVDLLDQLTGNDKGAPTPPPSSAPR